MSFAKARNVPEGHKQRGRAGCSWDWDGKKVCWSGCFEQKDEGHIMKMGRQTVEWASRPPLALDKSGFKQCSNVYLKINLFITGLSKEWCSAGLGRDRVWGTALGAVPCVWQSLPVLFCSSGNCLLLDGIPNATKYLITCLNLNLEMESIHESQSILQVFFQTEFCNIFLLFFHLSTQSATRTV